MKREREEREEVKKHWMTYIVHWSTASSNETNVQLFCIINNVICKYSLHCDVTTRENDEAAASNYIPIDHPTSVSFESPQSRQGKSMQGNNHNARQQQSTWLFLDSCLFCEREAKKRPLTYSHSPSLPLSPPLCTLNSKYVGVSMQNDKRDTSQTTTIELRQTTLMLSLAMAK